eukprot:TRINITY_DN384_c0_g1_i1.p1 TRINITY_DN384_c0_g1~~TRINITY_DN384_c0_g1_i1.p1  ORF type:complete len:227 (-),score=81.81 TRINITY_DN384_c0_g1_i1:91-717(-)
MFRYGLRRVAGMPAFTSIVRRSFATRAAAQTAREPQTFDDLAAAWKEDKDVGRSVRALLNSLNEAKNYNPIREKPNLFKDGKPSTINWDYYKKNMDPTLVNDVKKKYEMAMSKIHFDVAPFLSEYRAAVQAKIADLERERAKDVADLEELLPQIAETNREIERLDDITVAEELDRHPEIRAEIEHELENEDWDTKEDEGKGAAKEEHH